MPSELFTMPRVIRQFKASITNFPYTVENTPRDPLPCRRDAGSDIFSFAHRARAASITTASAKVPMTYFIYVTPVRFTSCLPAKVAKAKEPKGMPYTPFDRHIE